MPINDRFSQTIEGGVIAVKIDGVLRLAAIITAFMFWYSIAIILLVLFLSGVLHYSSLLSLAQVLSTLGFLPIPVALATWKVFEFLYAKYLTAYAKKYFQPS